MPGADDGDAGVVVYLVKSGKNLPPRKKLPFALRAPQQFVVDDAYFVSPQRQQFREMMLLQRVPLYPIGFLGDEQSHSFRVPAPAR
jgi:hypothetical protein